MGSIFGDTWVSRLHVPHGDIAVLVYVDQDEVTVERWTDTFRGEKNYKIPNFGTSIGELVQRPGARVGWGKFPDGYEVVYLYDRNDDCFGYAINLDAPDCSEWGYAPFVDVDINAPSHFTDLEPK